MATGTIGSTYNSGLRVIGGDLVDAALHENLVYEMIKDKASGSPQSVKKEGKAYYFYHNVKTANGNSGRNVVETGNRPIFYPMTMVPAKWALMCLMQPINLTGFAYYMGGLIGPPELTVESAELQALADGWALLMGQNLLYQGVQWITRVCPGTYSSSSTINVYDADLLDDNTYIDIYRLTGSSWSSVLTAKLISSVDRDTYPNYAVLNMSVADISCNAGDYIMLSSQYNTGMAGLGDIIQAGQADLTIGNYTLRTATDTYGNMARSTYAKWRAPVYQPVPNDAKDFDPLDLWTLIAKMRVRQGTGLAKIDMGLAHPYTIAAIIEKLPQYRVMGMGDGSIVYGSNKKVEISNANVQGGSFYLEGISGYKMGLIDMICKQALKIRWVEEPNFVLNENGNIFHRTINDAGTATDEWRGTFMGFMNLIASPFMFGCLAGINVPSSVRPW